MPFKSYRDESRKNWGSTQIENLNMEQMRTGALLRIADATESMANEYNRLLNEAKRARARADRLSSENQYLERRISALKGVITKMKKEDRNG